MAITYTWKINRIDAYPQVMGEQDVVYNVHWVLAGSEAGATASVYGTQEVTYDAQATFTAYEDLTEPLVLGWVLDAMSDNRVAEIEGIVAAHISEQRAPASYSPPLPWRA